MRRLIDNGNRPITPKPHIGHYGRLRKAYLEQYRHRLYTALVASEKLYGKNNGFRIYMLKIK